MVTPIPKRRHSFRETTSREDGSRCSHATKRDTRTVTRWALSLSPSWKSRRSDRMRPSSLDVGSSSEHRIIREAGSPLSFGAFRRDGELCRITPQRPRLEPNEIVLLRLPEPRQQLLVNLVESPITEDRDQIFWL